MYSNRLAWARVAGDSLRQVAIQLYKLWHQQQAEEFGETTSKYTLYWVTIVPEYDVMSPDFLNADLDSLEFSP